MIIMGMVDVKLAAWDYVFELKEKETCKEYINRIVEFRDYLVQHENSLGLANEVVSMELSERSTSSGKIFQKILTDIDTFEDLLLLYSIIENTDSGVVLRCLAQKRIDALKPQD